jgi:hypothetical protein
MLIQLYLEIWNDIYIQMDSTKNQELVADATAEEVCRQIVIEPNDTDDEVSEVQEEEEAPEVIKEQESETREEVVCEPEQEPVQMPKKKGKYTVTDKVRERNRKRSMVAQERRKEAVRKAAEYDKLKSEKSLTKKDAEELFTRIVELNRKSSDLQVPRLPPIREEVCEVDIGYYSDPSRQASSRFSRKESQVNHMSGRFTRY